MLDVIFALVILLLVGAALESMSWLVFIVLVLLVLL